MPPCPVGMSQAACDAENMPIVSLLINYFGINTDDPCVDAQPFADATTLLSTNFTFVSAKNSVEAAVLAQGNAVTEHSVTFGKDMNNNINISPILNTNGSNSGSVNSSWPGAFADLHNHPNDQPLSPGDLYNKSK